MREHYYKRAIRKEIMEQRRYFLVMWVCLSLSGGFLGFLTKKYSSDEPQHLSHCNEADDHVKYCFLIKIPLCETSI